MHVHVFPQEKSAGGTEMPTPQLRRLTRSWENPGWTHPLHAHRDQVELMFLSAGRMEVKADQHTFQCAQGDLVLLDRNIIHATNAVEGYPRDTWCCLLTGVELDCVAPGEGAGILRCNAGEYFQYVRDTFLQIYDFSRLNQSVTDPVCNHLMATLLLIFREKAQTDPSLERTSQPTFAQRVLIYLNDHFTEKITLDSLAKTFYTSKSHLGNEFKKEYDISPINYLIDKRLNESIWLLLNTDQPVHQVAKAVGYENPYHFIKLFSSRMGVSPSDYRIQCRSR